MLTGLLSPTSGSARILGHDVVADAVADKRLIGVVPEESVLFDRLTGPEQLRFVGRMYGMEQKVIENRTEELLALMGLGGDTGKLIVDHSHGIRKKLAISGAIIHEPKVLFLDEPVDGGGPPRRDFLAGVVVRLDGSGRSDRVRTFRSHATRRQGGRVRGSPRPACRRP